MSAAPKPPLVGRLRDWLQRRERPSDLRRQGRAEDAAWGGQQLGPATERPERPTVAPETPQPSGGKRWLT